MTTRECFYFDYYLFFFSSSSSSFFGCLVVWLFVLSLTNIHFLLCLFFLLNNSLGFHLAIEQLVLAVKSKRSLFGQVVDSLEDAFRAMDMSGSGTLEESDLARALHRKKF